MEKRISNSTHRTSYHLILLSIHSGAVSSDWVFPWAVLLYAAMKSGPPCAIYRTSIIIGSSKRYLRPEATSPSEHFLHIDADRDELGAPRPPSPQHLLPQIGLGVAGVFPQFLQSLLVRLPAAPALIFQQEVKGTRGPWVNLNLHTTTHALTHYFDPRLDHEPQQ